nr:hypothetical protein [Actinomycetota bacterium]
MKILLASTSRLALPTLELLEKSSHQILGILTKPEKPSGRGMESKAQELVSELDGLHQIFTVANQEELAETLRRVKADLVVAISFGMPTLAKKISPDELRISFDRKVDQIERQIRAFAPKPGAWAMFKGNRVKFLAAQVRLSASGSIGEVINVSPLLVAAKDGALLIGSLQEAGKRIMTSEEWARGVRLQVGEKFE